MIGVCHSKKKWTQLLFSGFCYAGLILSHLPSALLVAPLIAIFSVCVTKQSRRLHAISYAIFVGIVGVAVSAFYILPAIMLQDTLPYDAWVTGAGHHFQAVNWLIGNSGISNFGVKVYMVLAVTSLLSIGATFVFVAVSFRIKRHIRADETNWRLITACILSLVGCWFLMTNLSRLIWVYFPIVAQVQFPWRLGIIIDFCSVLLIGLAAPRALSYFLSLFSIKARYLQTIERVIAITALATIAITVIIVFFPSTIVSSRDKLTQNNPTEYRPKWLVESAIYLPAENIDDLTDINLANLIHKTGISRWKSFVEPLPPIASLRVLELNEAIRIDEKKIVTASISANLKSPATIRIRRVYYPHWRLIDNSGEEFDIYADTQTGLLLFDLPPGEHELTLVRRLLPSEQVGFIVSLVSIIVSLVWITAFGRRRVKLCSLVVHACTALHAHAEKVIGFVKEKI
jgi:hypothetical protein